MWEHRQAASMRALAVLAEHYSGRTRALTLAGLASVVTRVKYLRPCPAVKTFWGVPLCPVSPARSSKLTLELIFFPWCADSD